MNAVFRLRLNELLQYKLPVNFSRFQTYEVTTVGNCGEIGFVLFALDPDLKPFSATYAPH